MAGNKQQQSSESRESNGQQQILSHLSCISRAVVESIRGIVYAIIGSPNRKPQENSDFLNITCCIIWEEYDETERYVSDPWRGISHVAQGPWDVHSTRAEELAMGV